MCHILPEYKAKETTKESAEGKTIITICLARVDQIKKGDFDLKKWKT
jgi:hypothetical protein